MLKGVYVLVISVSKNISVNVGVLGRVNFNKGLYAYVGSAQNNLEKRIERHRRKAKRKFWHIDYLLDINGVKILKVFHKKAGKPEECKVARAMSERAIPIKGFGSSDCKCVSHLFKLKGHQLLREFMQEKCYDMWEECL